MKTFCCFCLILLSIRSVQASHLVGGYVQVKAVSGLTYTIKAFIYTHAGEPASQATTATICLGNGNSATAQRLSYQFLPANPSISVSTYQLVYTYAGPGIYTVAVSLPGRTAAKNSASADNQSFTLATTFSTNTSTVNTTPTLSFPDLSFQADVNKRLVFSLQASDSEGDSLVYGLARPYTGTDTDRCRYQPVTNYTFPNDLTRQGRFTLNNRTGEFVWDAPVSPGSYSLALSIFEYRNGLLISQTLQEIFITINNQSTTSGTIPSYEPAIEGSVVTAVESHADADITFTVFPNPVDDQLQVVIKSSNPATATIQLLAINGKKIGEFVSTTASRQYEQFISLGNLASGTYLILADINGRSLLRKVVKK